jgi:hypothetical protein
VPSRLGDEEDWSSDPDLVGGTASAEHGRAGMAGVLRTQMSCGSVYEMVMVYGALVWWLSTKCFANMMREGPLA